MAGLQVSNIWIANDDIRRKFIKEMDRSGYSHLNSLGLVAAQAAYENGEEWLLQCKRYLQGNLDFLRVFLRDKLPEIKLVEPDGTYFAWLDCSELGLNYKDLKDLIVNEARLWLDDGYIFGKKSFQFQRVVLALPQKRLAQALERLEAVVHNKV